MRNLFLDLWRVINISSSYTTHGLWLRSPWLFSLDSEKHGEAARAKVQEYTWEKDTETLVKLLKAEQEEGA